MSKPYANVPDLSPETKRALKEEFFIHFKDIPEEFQFLEAFISQRLVEVEKRGLKDGRAEQSHDCDKLVDGVIKEHKRKLKEALRLERIKTRNRTIKELQKPRI